MFALALFPRLLKVAAETIGLCFAITLLFGFVLCILLSRPFVATREEGGNGESPEPLSDVATPANESDEIRGLLSLWHARVHLSKSGMDEGDRAAWKLLYERAHVIIASVWFEHQAPKIGSGSEVN